MPTLAELTDAYVGAATQLRAAVAGMTREQLNARPIAGKWSTLEVVAHIADFEPVLADRMRRIAALNKPLLLVADENEFVKHLAYGSRDLEEELGLIEATRRQMARILRNLPEAALQRVGVHSEKGLVTLEQVIAGATKHIVGHLAHVGEKKKALGL